jgi:hypothetical protein
VVEGSFDSEEPTDAQLESLARMVAWGAMQFDVDLATVGGHRDHAATTCPGDNLYETIADGTLANRASEIIAEGGVTLSLGS